jgi:hypothetical protein
LAARDSVVLVIHFFDNLANMLVITRTCNYSS